MLARLSILLLFVSACASNPPPPSTPAERTPTPGTVSRENPAGDADNPVDAALMRLLEEPIGIKNDKFRTLRPRFADAANWKRVRFFGNPTRAAFRYGDDAYAAAVILYEEAADDTPRACLDAALERAHRLAGAFDVAIGPIRREMREYPRGYEAIDHEALEVATELEYERQKERLETRRKRIAEARAVAAERRRARLGRRATLALRPAVARPAEPEPALDEERRRAREEAEARREKGRRDRAHRTVLRKMIAEAGKVAIPAVLTDGRFQTLLNGDRYLAAVVAYPSWPGTCLVQGVAVRIGSDEALARDVIARWLDEQAPQLKWRVFVEPPIKNR